MKKLIVLLLIVLACGYSEKDVLAQGFYDINSHWAESDIKSMTNQGYVKGYPNGRFNPKGEITRSEFVTILTRILGLDNAQNPFSDRGEASWADGSIGSAVSKGIIVKAEYGSSFNPNQPITRLEMAKMIARAYALDSKYKNVLNTFNGLYNGDLPFVDYRELKASDVPFVALAFGTGTLNGYEDASFKLNKKTNRAESAVMLSRFLKKKEQQPTSFQYINEMIGVATSGTNAQVVPFVQTRQEDYRNLVVNHPSMTIKFKRVYVIPIKGSVKSMYERKFLWDRNEMPSHYMNQDAYVAGVADISFKKYVNNHLILETVFITPGANAFYYRTPSDNFGFFFPMVEKEYEWNKGDAVEGVFYSSISDKYKMLHIDVKYGDKIYYIFSKKMQQNK